MIDKFSVPRVNSIRKYMPLFWLLGVALICSCGDDSNIDAAKEKVVQYYVWVGQDRIDSVFTLFPKGFITQSDSIKFVEKTIKRKELGSIISYECSETNQETIYTANKGKEIHVRLKYKVEYNNGMIFDQYFVFVTNDKGFNQLMGIEIEIGEK